MIIFVSYSHLDKDFALRLVKILRDWGHNPWLDNEQIPKGKNWPDEIDKGLDSSDVVVGVLSENAMTSGVVKSEWEYALVNNKPLILMRLRPVKVSFRFVRINYIDCVENEKIGLDELQNALQSPKTSFINETLGTTTKRAVKPIESPEKWITNRAAMLHNLHNFWIKGMLEPIEIGDVWLDLPAGQRPNAVEPKIKRELHNPDFDTFLLGVDQKIVNVFRRMGNELLILGASGSGKTTALLELARELIAQAQKDDTQPIPVVFNLASWAEKRSDKLENWLVERLFLDYGVLRKLGTTWIDNGNLLFLFDGLDEVSETYRDACVTAINTFWRKYDQVDNGIVICSRIADYEKLTTTLHLENAILLDALTPAQVNDYLTKLGTSWHGLRTVISTDMVLQAFAASPLLLNVMAVAYRDTPREQIIGLGESDQKRILFDRYVARQLRDNKVPDKYPNVKSLHYLGWLATKLVEHQRIVMYIEDLQADWLDTEQQIWQYHWYVRWLLRLVVGDRSGDWIYGIDHLDWSWQEACGAFVFGLIIVLSSSLISGIGVAFVHEMINHLGGKPNDTLELIGGGLAYGLGGGLIFGLGGGLIFGLFKGLTTTTLEKRTNPNQGIHQSAQNALVSGLVFGLLFGLVGGMVGGVAYVLSGGVSGGLGAGLFGALIFGLAGVLIGGLGFGGATVIKHVILRRILYNAGAVPLNYADFLDYCVSRQLLRRVGGGYIFRHRMLMEYFAEYISRTTTDTPSMTT